MELQRAARVALGSLSATASRPPTASLLGCLSSRQRVLQRPFSTTAARLAPPPESEKPQSSSFAPWPPKRSAQSTSQSIFGRPNSNNNNNTTATTTTTSSSASPAAASADPLKDLYGSDNPAQWALWSSDDFYRRHMTGQPAQGAPRIRLKPATGRTVHVSGNVDPARALALLEARCRSNRIQADFQRQRFHERPGLRRKRLRSQRWRNRFRDSIKATIARVEELAAQGW